MQKRWIPRKGAMRLYNNSCHIRRNVNGSRSRVSPGTLEGSQRIAGLVKDGLLLSSAPAVDAKVHLRGNRWDILETTLGDLERGHSLGQVERKPPAQTRYLART